MLVRKRVDNGLKKSFVSIRQRVFYKLIRLCQAYTMYTTIRMLSNFTVTIARRITIVENSLPGATVEFNQIKDLNTTDGSLFIPSADMKGPGIMIGPPMRFPQIAENNSAAAATGVVQPIIIHAALDVSGRVVEAEALQISNSALSDAA
jgi:hypothetical protein